MNTTNIEIWQIIGIAAAIAASIFGGVNYLLIKSFNKGRDSQRFDNVESKVNEYSKKQTTCDTKFAVIEQTKANTVCMESRFNEVIAAIKDLALPTKKIITDPYAAAHSPLTLTPKGVEKVESLGINNMIDKKWDDISNFVSSNVKSRNPYDIQQFFIGQCWLFPEKFVEADDLDKLKLDAYNEGISIDSYMRIIAILSLEKFSRTSAS